MPASPPTKLMVREDPTVSGWVIRKSFRLADLPRELWGALRARDLLPLWAALALMLVFAYSGLPFPGLVIAAIVMMWVRWTTIGKVTALGLFTADGKLVGGIRLRHNQRRRTVLLAGLFVEPGLRGHGGARQLALASLQRSAQLLNGAGTVLVYAPAHPASVRLVEHYFGGPRLQVGSEQFAAALQRLAS